MRGFEWLFTGRRSYGVLEDQAFESRLAQYCQLPGGQWCVKRELTLPSSTKRLFLPYHCREGTNPDSTRTRAVYAAVIKARTRRGHASHRLSLCETTKRGDLLLHLTEGPCRIRLVSCLAATRPSTQYRFYSYTNTGHRAFSATNDAVVP
jgi:hypothetical protein